MSTFDLGWIYLALGAILTGTATVRLDVNGGPKKATVNENLHFLESWLIGLWLQYLGVATWFGWWPQ